MDAMSYCLGTGRLDGRQAVGQNRVEDVDHLPIAIIGTRMTAGASQNVGAFSGRPP
jgi:hypothetical protein